MTGLFAAALFTSAALLFWVQPLFARMILPRLGGAPAVWNASMVFFQTALLAGYLWAHLSTRRIGLRAQSLVHLVIGLAAVTVLPVVVRRGEPPVDADPLPWLLLTMAVSVGLPAFVLSGTAPLLQRWFSATGHRQGRDPYFLYAASNTGSLAALLAYPFLLEPNLTLAAQSSAWSAGYGALLLLVAACAVTLWGAGPPEAVADVAPTAAPSWPARLRWAVLALVPSSLLLGVTAHISTNIASMPLLWVVPFAIYLATYVLTFARRRVVPHRLVLASQPLLTAAALFAAIALTQHVLVFPLYLAALFVTAMACHGELAAARPDPAHLTEFYLWISVGGVLGGIVNTFLAPALFTSVEEFPLVLAAACFLRPAGPASGSAATPGWRRLLSLAPAAALALLFLSPAAAYFRLDAPGTPARVVIGLAFAACLAFAGRPAWLGASLTATAIVALMGTSGAGNVIFAERNAFGVVKVRDLDGGIHTLVNGTTLHGSQFTDPARRAEPLSYYRRTGPLGDVFAARRHRLRGKAVAVIGLGAGTMAAYGEPGQRYDFYEINPVVERVARDPRFFTYLADCPAEVRVILGDGRLQLAKAPDRSYALIVLDAFTSDAIPVHLLTREALKIYLSKLEYGGALAFHVSNRYLDLAPVLIDLARDSGLQCVYKQGAGGQGGDVYDVGPTWAVMVRNLTDAGSLYDFPDWNWLEGPEGARVWTDDYANVLGTLVID